jgi:drug/metabolite transporter (DMT)-like permease
VLQSGISPLELTQVRATGAFLGFALLLALTRRETLRLTRRELPYLVVFGIAGVAFVQWLYFVAIGRLPIGIALLLEFLGPILIAIWAWGFQGADPPTALARTRARTRRALARSSRSGAGLSLDGLGVAAALTAAVAYAVYVLMAEHAVSWRDPASLSAYGFLFAALFWAAVQPLWRFPAGRLDDSVSLLGHLEQHALPVWLLLLYVVVAGTMSPSCSWPQRFATSRRRGSGSSRCSSRSPPASLPFSGSVNRSAPRS